MLKTVSIIQGPINLNYKLIRSGIKKNSTDFATYFEGLSVADMAGRLLRFSDLLKRFVSFFIGY